MKEISAKDGRRGGSPAAGGIRAEARPDASSTGPSPTDESSQSDKGVTRALAIAAVVSLTAVNYFGIRKTVGLTKVIVGVVVIALAACLFATLAGGTVRVDRLWPLDSAGPRSVLQAAGLLFFAFAGYARIATLGEEVVDPARTIPRAIPLALGLTLLVYAAVLVSSLAAAGSSVLGRVAGTARGCDPRGTFRRHVDCREDWRHRRFAGRPIVAHRRRQPNQVRDGRRARSAGDPGGGPSQAPSPSPR